MKKFSELSPLSRVWVYQSDRTLTESEVSEIQLLSAAFVSHWTAHGSMLMASADVFYCRFLVLVADENQVLASGCSIDKSVAFVKDLEKYFSLNLLDRMNIAYLENNELRTFPFQELENLAEAGVITPDTLVFNNLVKTLSELKHNWIVKISNTWLGNRLPANSQA
jgi:hypothetical protein